MLNKKIFFLSPLLLLGVSVSNGAVDIPQTSIISMGSALTNAGVSLLSTLINFAPFLIGLAAAGMVFSFISGLVRPKQP